MEVFGLPTGIFLLGFGFGILALKYLEWRLKPRSVQVENHDGQHWSAEPCSRARLEKAAETDVMPGPTYFAATPSSDDWGPPPWKAAARAAQKLSLDELVRYAASLHEWNSHGTAFWDEEPTDEDWEKVEDFTLALTSDDLQTAVTMLERAGPGEIDVAYIEDTGADSWPEDDYWVVGLKHILERLLTLRPPETMTVLQNGMENEGCRTIILECCARVGAAELLPWLLPWVGRWQELNRRAQTDLATALSELDWRPLSAEQTGFVRDALLFLRTQADHLDPETLSRST